MKGLNFQKETTMTKNLKQLTLTSAIFLFFSLSAVHAHDDIKLGIPGYGGNGCPSGSASATLSPDQKSLSLIFDEFVVEAGGETRRRIARKSCNLAIPVHIPQGLSVSIIKVDYRGYNFLPRGASSKFSVEYFFAGSRGPKYTKTFRGELDDEYLLENTLPVESMVWSACGADVNLRVNSSMLVKTNRQKSEALSTVDSADFSSGIIYQLSWKRC
jgi:hypothetical protein